MSSIEATRRWLVVEVAEQAFGIDVESIQELLDLTSQSVHRLPRSSPHMLGMLRVRESVLPLVDLRRLIGVPSMEAETESVIELLNERRRDHVNWLSELEASVDESRPFRLTTDPHACAFGRWYDQLMADRKAVDRFTNGNLALRNVLESFDLCHQRIHAIAHQVTNLVETGDVAAARAVIEATRNGDLKRMIALFERACELVGTVRHPRVVLVRIGGDVVGLAVDDVCQVAEIATETYRYLNVGTATSFVECVATDACGRLIQLINLEDLERQLTGDETAAGASPL